jgi:hypothetical protein
MKTKQPHDDEHHHRPSFRTPRARSQSHPRWSGKYALERRAICRLAVRGQHELDRQVEQRTEPSDDTMRTIRQCAAVGVEPNASSRQALTVAAAAKFVAAAVLVPVGAVIRGDTRLCG